MLPLKHDTMDYGSYSIIEEKLNSMTHAVGALLAIIGLTVLVMAANSTATMIAAWVYGLSLIAMFVSSSIYHASKDPQKRNWLRKIDHIAIYLLIAGSYTPFMAIGVGGTLGIVALIVVWAIGIAGIFFKLFLGHKYPRISITTYAVMGWLALFLIYPIYQSLDIQGFILLVAGGLCYSAGIPLYLLKSRHYSHALWHLCVVAGAACHFLAIYYYIY